MIHVMARILISEPHPDVCRLFERMVQRLGHEPVVVVTVTEDEVARADALLVETAAPSSAELAMHAARLRPGFPIVAASISPYATLTVRPAAHLVKPFSLDELRAALDAVLVTVAAS